MERPDAVQDIVRGRRTEEPQRIGQVLVQAQPLLAKVSDPEINEDPRTSDDTEFDELLDHGATTSVRRGFPLNQFVYPSRRRAKPASKPAPESCSGDDEPHLARDGIPGRDIEMLPRIEFLDAEATVLPEHHERPIPADPNRIGIGVRDAQRQTQRIARNDLFGQPRKGNIHQARRMEMRVDEPREAFAVGQYDAPDAAVVSAPS